jgi:hypothetical protein
VELVVLEELVLEDESDEDDPDEVEVALDREPWSVV